MKQLDITEAQAAFSEIVERAASGEETLITKNGEPLARLLPARKSRLGTLKGICHVPDDFDTLYAKEIEDMFNGKEE